MAVAAADDLLLQVTEKLLAMGIGDALFLLKQQQLVRTQVNQICFAMNRVRLGGQ